MNFCTMERYCKKRAWLSGDTIPTPPPKNIVVHLSTVILNLLSKKTEYNHKIELQPDREMVTKYSLPHSPLYSTLSTDLTSTVTLNPTEIYLLPMPSVSNARKIQFFGKGSKGFGEYK